MMDPVTAIHHRQSTIRHALAGGVLARREAAYDAAPSRPAARSSRKQWEEEVARGES